MRRSVIAAFLFSCSVPLFASASGRYIVVTKNPFHGQLRQALRDSADNTVTADAPGRDVVAFELINGYAADLTDAEVAALQKSPDVRWVEPVIERRALGTTALVHQIAPYGVGLVQAQTVWPTARGNAINVVVIDTGVDYRHPELVDIYKGGVNFVNDAKRDNPFDDNGHGTHVAGIIAAADNGFGVVGVAPNVRLWTAKVLNADGSGTSGDIIEALDWVRAQKKALGGNWIVNLSLGSAKPSSAERAAFDALQGDGVLAFAASGNESTAQLAAPLAYPAGYDSVVSVGAIDAHRTIADFSNQGAGLDLVAPGVSVLSTVPLGTGAIASVIASDKLVLGAPLTGSGGGTVTSDYVYCGLGKQGDFPATVSGKIALIKRGDIKFAEKVMNAVAAGATAVALFNKDDSPLNFTLYDEDNPATLQYNWPVVVAIPLADGEALAQTHVASITVANQDDDYMILSGTSMASPHAAGAAALVWSVAPNAPATSVRDAMTGTAVDLGIPGADAVFGAGLIDVYAAARRLNPTLTVPSSRPTTGRTILKRGH